MYSLYKTHPTTPVEHLPALAPRVQDKDSSYFLNHPYRCSLLVVGAAIALIACAAVAESNIPEAHQQGDIVYISGGIGTDETDAIESMKGDYNLNVTSADRTGHFRGDTEIVISDMKRNVLLDVTAQGPLFYAQLPKGRYVIEGISEDQSRKQTVSITGTKTARVHFSWPTSVADLSDDANLRNDLNLSHDNN